MLEFLVKTELPMALRDILELYNYAPENRSELGPGSEASQRQLTVQEAQKKTSRTNEIFFLALDSLNTIIKKAELLAQGPSGHTEER